MTVKTNQGMGKFPWGRRGFVFPLVLVFLMIGSLLITPLVTFLATGLNNGKVYERKVNELYAADAGVGEARLYIKSNGHVKSIPTVNGSSFNYTIPDVDGKQVSFNITLVNGSPVSQSIFKITSTAVTPGTGSNTTIEAYIAGVPYFWTNAITTNGTAAIFPGADIVGPVENNYPADKWPFTTQPSLLGWYLAQVGPPADATHPNPPYPIVASPAWPADNYTLTEYNVAVPPKALGPIYREGNIGAPPGSEKGIYSSAAGASANIQGTIYVKGNVDIGKNGQNFDLYLNNQTIFAEGNINVGGKTTIHGSGCIIALGDIHFMPNLASGPNDFVFIMSVNGQVYFSPGGNFYGSVAGLTTVDLHPGNTFTLPEDPPTNLNFPMGDLTELGAKIRTWLIK